MVDLPGPPAFARFASFGQASQRHKLKAKRAKAAAPKPSWAKAGWCRSPKTKNIENNPMHSSRWLPAGTLLLSKTV